MAEGESRSPSLEIGQTSPINKDKGKGKKTVTSGPDWQKIGAKVEVKLKKREHSPEDDLSKKLKLYEKAAPAQDIANIVTNENSDTPEKVKGQLGNFLSE